MNKSKLEQFCKDKGIYLPKDATIASVCATIVRAKLHQSDIEFKKGSSCFGFWEHENGSCIICNREKDCSEVSLGMSKERYFKHLKSTEFHQVRMTKKLSTSKKLKI